jgi:4-hydroxybenzoate polyprenyltransferase
MAIAARDPITLTTLLKLGRVSNLPTVWTNVLAGIVIAGHDWQSSRTVVVIAAMSFFYIGGMFLNDYFDRAVDSRERPERPIPAGEISSSAVAAIGLGELTLAAALLAMTSFAAAAVGILLGAVIVGYDTFHKNNPVAPIIMGLCRALIYCGAAAAFDQGVPQPVMLAALTLLAYVAGLTYAARQESLDKIGSLWPLLVLSAPFLLALPALRQGLAAIMIYILLVGATSYAIRLLARRSMQGAVSQAVAMLIAGISLVDAALLASIGAVGPASLAVAGFGATLLLQKYIAGT